MNERNKYLKPARTAREEDNAIADFFGVTLDDLIGRSGCRQLCVEGLTDAQIQHLNAIISDLRTVDPKKLIQK